MIRAWPLLLLALVGLAGTSSALAADSNRPLSLGVHVPPGATPAAVADSLSAWLARTWSPSEWRPGTDGLLAHDVRQLDGRTFVRLRQTFRGSPVSEGEACVSIDGAGQAVVLGHLLPALDPPPPSESESRAKATALDALARSAPGWSAAGVPWVVRDERGDRIVWRVEAQGPRDWDRQIVWRDDGAASPARIEHAGASATALVYPNDGASPLTEVTLDRLAGDGSRLEGQWAAARDLLRPDWVAPDGDFRLAPTDPDSTRFDEANVYWYADHFTQDFLVPLGFPGFNPRLTVRVHEGIWPPYTALTVDNYVLLAPAVEFFFRDPAKGRDLVVHEIQHAVTELQGVQSSGYTRHPAALHEGLSDYFAAAYTGDPAIGEWVYFRYPNGATRVDMPASEYNFARWDSVSYGPNPVQTQWANGMILSAALWDLRSHVGRTADSLTFEALRYCPSEPQWGDFANGLVLADLQRHGGANRDAIVQSFVARGIIGRTSAAISGPTAIAPESTATYRSLASGSGLVRSVRWLVRRECRDNPCPEGWVPVGSRDTLAFACDTDYTLRLESLNVWGGVDAVERFVNVLPPRVRIVGPTVVPQGSRNVWRADVRGMGNESVVWWRNLRRYGVPREYLGAGPAVEVPAETSFVLTVSVQDRFYRSTSVTLDVTTKKVTTPSPPSERTGALVLAQRLAPGARDAEVHFEVPQGGVAELAVWDVGGRRRRVVWNGPAGSVPRVQHWDTAGLEPGIYVLRLRVAEGEKRIKFAILH